MAITATTLVYYTGLTVTEILGGNVVGLSDKTVKHSSLNKSSGALDSTTTPPVTKVATFNQALSGGAATIDLNALTGTNGAAVNGEGLRIQAIKLSAPSTNANVITATFGGTHPYNLAGAAWSVALLAGQEFVFYGNDATPDIEDGVASAIDLAGTASQTLNVCIVMG